MRVYSITHQGAFDKIVRHFIYNEMPLSIRRDKKCFYRLSDPDCGTLKCAVGVLIPDALYDPEMEGTRATELAEKFPALARRFQEIPLSALYELQHLHDDYAWEGDDPLRIARSLVGFAKAYGLHVSARLRRAAGDRTGRSRRGTGRTR